MTLLLVKLVLQYLIKLSLNLLSINKYLYICFTLIYTQITESDHNNKTLSIIHYFRLI